MGKKDGRVVRWGILGAGKIAHRFARSLSHDPRCELVAISCRSAEKARTFALEHGVPESRTLSDEALGGVAGAAHSALLARPDLDAIYLALPHGMHLEWGTAALRAGKAVLCEKPLCVSAEETRRLAEVSRRTGTLLMEGMKTRFLPAYQRVRELVADGAIGRLERVEAVLQNAMLERIARGGDYLSAPVGGGMLLWEAGVDCAVDAELRFGEKTARLLAAADRDNTRYARLVGSEGQIVVEQPHRPERVTIERAGERPLELDLPHPVDDFFGEIEHFVGLLLDGEVESPVMPHGASVRCAEMLDAIRAAI